MVAAPDMCRHRVAQLQLLRRTQRTGDLLLLHVLCTPSQQALSSQGRAQGRGRGRAAAGTGVVARAQAS